MRKTLKAIDTALSIVKDIDKILASMDRQLGKASRKTRR